MVQIRSYNFLDSLKISKLESMLHCSDDIRKDNALPPFAIRFLHWMLPVSWKTLPEAYCSINQKKLSGVIILKPNKGNWRKWKITKLILDENSQLDGCQLIDYVVSRYGAAGVNTFIVNVETSQQEVLELFSKGCGFKFCSFEQLWKLNKIVLSKPNFENYSIRQFRNEDAKNVCDLYNLSIHPQYRNSLCKSKSEFYDGLFQGLEQITSYKYVIENKNNANLSGYILIKTTDNKNFMLELTLNDIHNENLNDIIGFAIHQISKRVKTFNLFVINKKYKQNSQIIEEYLQNSDFTLKQNQSVLVKDYFKRIQDETFTPAIIFNNIKGKPVYNDVL